jgi:hypothetical protein
MNTAIFQKSKKADAIKYLDWEKPRERIKKTFYEIFATAGNNEPLMESTDPRDKEMWEVVKNITPLDWSTIITVKEFRNWIWQQIKKQNDAELQFLMDTEVHEGDKKMFQDQLISDLLSSIRVTSMGKMGLTKSDGK